MSGIVAIVGRPNVGKSTLFNRLTKSRRALVDDLPGVTRDRLYGEVTTGDRTFTLVDTGGFDPPADQDFAEQVHEQIEVAMAEADLILFITDARAGLNPLDFEVARRLRRTNKPVIQAVNKVDGPSQEDDAAEFYALAQDIHFISSAHGHGVAGLLEDIAARLPAVDAAAEDPEDYQGPIKVALLGRPNVGKSSLLNRLVGDQRVVVSEVPGTTRDVVDTPLSTGGRDYLLIDTAGIRRHGKIGRGLEKASVFRSLRACQRAHVVIVLMDASEGVTDGDLRAVGQAVQAHRGVMVLLNKWDLVKDDSYQVRQVRLAAERSLRFAPWAPVHQTSLVTGQGVKKVLPTVRRIYDQYSRRISTGDLNQALEEITAHHPPPMVRGKRLKLYYASQVSTRPPTVVIFANNPKAVHFSYRRYLTNELRRVLGVDCAPVRLVLRQRSGRKASRGPRRGRRS